MVGDDVARAQSLRLFRAVMLGNRVRLIATGLATHMQEFTFGTGLALTQILVKANRLVLGCPRMHTLKGLRNGITCDLCLLIGARALLLTLMPLLGLAWALAAPFAPDGGRLHKVHHLGAVLEQTELGIQGQ